MESIVNDNKTQTEGTSQLTELQESYFKEGLLDYINKKNDSVYFKDNKNKTGFLFEFVTTLKKALEDTKKCLPEILNLYFEEEKKLLMQLQLLPLDKKTVVTKINLKDAENIKNVLLLIGHECSRLQTRYIKWTYNFVQLQSGLREDLRLKQQAIKEHLESIVSLETQKNEIEETVSTLKQEKNQLSQEKEKLGNQLVSLREQIENVSQKATQATEDLKTKSNELISTQKQIIEATTNVSTLKLKVQELETQKSNLEENEKKLKQSVKTLTEQEKKLKQSLRKTREELQNKTLQLDNTLRHNETLNETIQELKIQLQLSRSGNTLKGLSQSSGFFETSFNKKKVFCLLDPNTQVTKLQMLKAAKLCTTLSEKSLSEAQITAAAALYSLLNTEEEKNLDEIIEQLSTQKINRDKASKAILRIFLTAIDRCETLGQKDSAAKHLRQAYVGKKSNGNTGTAYDPYLTTPEALNNNADKAFFRPLIKDVLQGKKMSATTAVSFFDQCTTTENLDRSFVLRDTTNILN